MAAVFLLVGGLISVLLRNKAELIFLDGPWAGRDDIEAATAQWVHWYNTERSTASSTTAPRPRSRPSTTNKTARHRGLRTEHTLSLKKLGT